MLLFRNHVCREVCPKIGTNHRICTICTLFCFLFLLPCVFFVSWLVNVVEQQVVRHKRTTTEFNSVNVNWERADEKLFAQPAIVRLFREFISASEDKKKEAKQKLFTDIANITGTQVQLILSKFSPKLINLLGIQKKWEEGDKRNVKQHHEKSPDLCR